MKRDGCLRGGVKIRQIRQTGKAAEILFIRVMVGGVFLSEGIQKFLFPNEVGAGRFSKIGIPFSEFLAPLTGGIEALAGGMLLCGLLTRIAVFPLLFVMLGAVISTKVPILLGHGFWGFSLRAVPYAGIWGMLHEARTDFCMILGALFLGITGSGPWSIDHWIDRNHPRSTSDSSV
jgi:uncharacterized membrane protein YphA (DoxX/SURF4 family)